MNGISWFTQQSCAAQPFSTKKQPIYARLIPLTTAFSLLFVTGQLAKAATLRALNEGTVVDTFTECINDGIAMMVGQNPTDEQGWQYTLDSFNDGVNGYQVGGNVYEIYGLALRETSDSIWVALNANMPLTGATAPSAADGNIGWGDLFFNFSGTDFTTASNEGNLFAVRFAGTNDSFAPTIGLYDNVTATSTTAINSGFSSIQNYNEWVSVNGGNPSLGDLPANTYYFDQTQSLNAIASGTYLTGITYLSPTELTEAGYKLNQFGGSQTIAFKFDKSAICNSGYCKSVPEPSGVFGLAVVGLIFGGSQFCKRYRKGKSEGL